MLGEGHARYGAVTMLGEGHARYEESGGYARYGAVTMPGVGARPVRRERRARLVQSEAMLGALSSGSGLGCIRTAEMV